MSDGQHRRPRAAARVRPLACALAVLLLAALGSWQLANARAFQLFGRIVARVETRAPLVALTFDDGPEPSATRELLRELASTGVRATFFLEGRRIEQHMAATRAIVAAGHELGNHSYSHRRMVFKTPAFIAQEIERTDRAIRAAGYRGTIHFRPPYGKKLLLLPWYLARHDRTTIMWDLEPDSAPEIAQSQAAIAEFVVTRARPGSIALLHVMSAERRTSLRAVRALVHGLRRRGYDFATVSELLRRSGEGH